MVVLASARSARRQRSASHTVGPVTVRFFAIGTSMPSCVPSCRRDRHDRPASTFSTISPMPASAEAVGAAVVRHGNAAAIRDDCRCITPDALLTSTRLVDRELCLVLDLAVRILGANWMSVMPAFDDRPDRSRRRPLPLKTFIRSNAEGMHSPFWYLGGRIDGDFGDPGLERAATTERPYPQ